MMDKLRTQEERIWYACKTIENGWSKTILELQIESRLMERAGKTVNNFPVAFELKIGEFKPEHVGKINFYLGALDREVKKDNENPSVGVILCTSKEDEVVEFALSRSLSPTMVSEYNLKLIDKKLLQKKLKEYI